MAILPFLAMSPKYAEPKNSLPVPLPQPGNQSTSSFDANLINQLENARYGQSEIRPPAPELINQIIAEEQQQGQPTPTQQKVSAVSTGMGGMPEEVSPVERPMTAAERYAQAYEEAINAQKESIAQAQAKLEAARKGPAQMDLTPLVALASQWTGKNLMSGYVQPQDKAKQVQALEEAVLKARGGLTATQLTALKEAQEQEYRDKALQKEDEWKRMQIAAMRQGKEGKKDFQEEKFQADVEEKYRKEFGTNISNLGKFAQNVNRLKEIVRSKGIPTTGAAASEYDRLVSTIATQYNQDVAKLGALAGADLKLITSGIGQSVGWLDKLSRETFGGGAKGAEMAIDALLKDADMAVEQATARVKGTSVADRLEKALTTDIQEYQKGRMAYGSSSLDQKRKLREQLLKEAGEA